MGLIITLPIHKAIKSPDEMETLQMELCDTMDAMKIGDGAPEATAQPEDHRRQADKDRYK